MKIPRYTQLTSVCEHVLQAMQSHAGLMAELQASQVSHVLRRVYPMRIFYGAPDGMRVEKVDMPCIGIYPQTVRSEWVHGSMGMKVTLGVQYLYQARQPDRGHTLEGAVTHHTHLVWWALCETLQDQTDLMSDAGIHRLYPVSMAPVPPMANAVRGFEGTAEMEYNHPPYPKTGLVDLLAIDGTYNLVDSDGTSIQDDIMGSYNDGFQD